MRRVIGRQPGEDSTVEHKKAAAPDDWDRGLIGHFKQPFDSEGSGIRSWGEQESDVTQPVSAPGRLGL